MVPHARERLGVRQGAGEENPVGHPRLARDGLQLGPQRAVAHHRQGDLRVAPRHLDECLHESSDALDLDQSAGEEPAAKYLGGSFTAGYGINVDRVGQHSHQVGVVGQRIEHLVAHQPGDTQQPFCALEHLSVVRQALRVGQLPAQPGAVLGREHPASRGRQTRCDQPAKVTDMSVNDVRFDPTAQGGAHVAHQRLGPVCHAHASGDQHGNAHDRTDRT